jgi:glycosyltransferase involved in cell wall biosynthesis
MKSPMIIPCYNERDSLARLLTKVKEAPVHDKEIVLLDNGSSDGTIDLLKNKLAREFGKVIYH